jgi:hypothetical protein
VTFNRQIVTQDVLAGFPLVCLLTDYALEHGVEAVKGLISELSQARPGSSCNPGDADRGEGPK